MGVFDTYGNRQMKIGDPRQRQFKVGDSVKESAVDDGVYLDTSESDSKAIVVKDGIFLGEFDVYGYWGEPYTWEAS